MYSSHKHHHEQVTSVSGSCPRGRNCRDSFQLQGRHPQMSHAARISQSMSVCLMSFRDPLPFVVFPSRGRLSTCNAKAVGHQPLVKAAFVIFNVVGQQKCLKTVPPNGAHAVTLEWGIPANVCSPPARWPGRWVIDVGGRDGPSVRHWWRGTPCFGGGLEGW